MGDKTRFNRADQKKVAEVREAVRAEPERELSDFRELIDDAQGAYERLGLADQHEKLVAAAESGEKARVAAEIARRYEEEAQTELERLQERMSVNREALQVWGRLSATIDAHADWLGVDRSPKP